VCKPLIAGSRSGGAIHMPGRGGVIQDSIFRRNVAAVEAGAAFIYGSVGPCSDRESERLLLVYGGTRLSPFPPRDRETSACIMRHQGFAPCPALCPLWPCTLNLAMRKQSDNPWTALPLGSAAYQRL
jgi:hypothetical protein